MGKPHLTLGEVIKILREAKGLSQEELGARASIHRTYVSQLERCVKSPTIAVLEQVAKALDTKPSQILKMMEER